MDHNKLKTKAELSTEIGVSRATLYRMLEKMNIETKRGLLPPDDQDRIRAAFGLKPLEKGSGDVRQNETK